MTFMPSRICTLLKTVGLALMLLSAANGSFAQDVLQQTAQEVEARIGGRIGYAMADLASGQKWGYRADERFPVSSTFKALLCGVILIRVDAGEERLDRRIAFGRDDLVTYSPVTERHVDEGM